MTMVPKHACREKEVGTYQGSLPTTRWSPRHTHSHGSIAL